MKTIFQTIFTLLLFTTYCSAQLTFQKTYSLPYLAGFMGGSITNDGGYIMAGFKRDFNSNGDNDVFTVKTDMYGNVQWARSLNTIYDGCAYAVKQTFDNGYIIAATLGTAWNEDVLLVKLDPAGNITWANRYGTLLFSEYGFNVEQTADSGFIIIGQTSNSIPCCHSDIYVIKTNSQGVILWNKEFHGYDGYEYGFSIHQTNDGYVFCGSKDTTGIGPFYTWVIKINLNGILQWAKTYGVGRGDAIISTTDGGYAVAGYGAGSSVMLLKTDSMGNMEWKKLYDRSGILSFAFDLKQTQDGGFVLAGQTGGLGYYDAFIFKTDALGDTLWTKFYGGLGNDIANKVECTADGGYALFGSTEYLGGNYTSGYIIKTDSMGNSVCNNKNFVFNVSSDSVSSIAYPAITTYTTPTSIPVFTIDSAFTSTTLCLTSVKDVLPSRKLINNIYPNPTKGSFTINFQEHVIHTTIQIYNTVGKLILSEVHTDLSGLFIKLNIPCKGLYFVKVVSGNLTEWNKVIVN